MSHTFINLSFEDADPASLVTLDGHEFEADGWTISEVFTAEEVADFSDATVRLGSETFELNWSNSADELEDFPSGTETATFNSEAFEDFETGWPATPVLVLAPTEEAVWNSTDNADGFEAGWNNDSFLFELDSIEAASQNSDTFEQGWNNDDFFFTATSLPLDEASFSAASSNSRLVEDFELLVDYVWQITLVVSSNSSGLWVIAVNGEYAAYQAQNEALAEVRTGLVNAVSGIDGFEGVAGASSNILYVKVLELPPDVTLDVSVENPSTGERISKRHGNFVSWSQSGFLATDPPTF